MDIKQMNEDLQKLKPFVHGHGKQVCEKAGVEYQTYMYYMRGLGRNPDKYKKIIAAAKSVAKKMAAQIEQL